MTNNPKPGDRLTAAEARDLPNGAVVDFRYTVGQPIDEMAHTLVSLPGLPDMAPGSLVVTNLGFHWMRDYEMWHSESGGRATWPRLRPNVAKVVHDGSVKA